MLSAAAKFGQAEAVKTLIDAQADVNHQDRQSMYLILGFLCATY